MSVAGPADLEGRVVAVAGVAGGLGPLVAERLARGGAVVCGADREAAAAEQALASLPEERRDASAVDLLDAEQAASWAAAIRASFGRVDALVHLVGGWRGGRPLHEAPLSDWDLLQDLLVRTVQHTSRAFHDPLLESGRGRFVLVSARQAQAPSNDNAAYAAAKAAAEAWTLALADGFRDGAATANVIVVDGILTPRMRAEDPQREFPTFTPAEHVADAIAFVCSDAAAKMNGQRLSLTPR